MAQNKLIGFTVEMTATARCPKGHTYHMRASNTIAPTDGITDSHAKSTLQHLKMCYRELVELTECEACAKAANTLWRP